MSSTGVDLNSCDREPIHLAGAIQPFGALIVVDADGCVSKRSANVSELLGVELELERPLAAPLAELLAPLRAALNAGHATRSEEEESFEPLELTREGRTFDVVAHRNGASLVVEFEPRAVDAPAAWSFALKAQRALERVQRQRSVESVLEVATDELFHITGFDRVMTYRFLHDESGHVIAERRREQLETFLGLRYPATDIPAQARRLFALNRLRFIPDLGYRAVPLEPSSGPDAKAPLDLSHSMLRSVSPIHVEYLKNMAVTASMSASIVVGGKLWGLFACHHYSGARLVPHAVRAACTLLAQVVSVMVERMEMEQLSRALDGARDLRDKLTHRAGESDDVIAALVAEPSFLGLVEAEGGAILWEKRVQLLGRTPGLDAVGALAEWLKSRREDLFVTQELGSAAPELASQLDGSAGLLAVRFHREQGGWLLWFRPEETETVRWAGNPEKTYSEGPLGPRLNPRGSFSEWRETVRGKSAPFRQHELEVASAFRLDLQQVALGKLSELERARDVMLAALGHDLRTPLSAISMAATLLRGGHDGSQDLGVRIGRSSGRMQRLIDQMLDLSRIQAGLGLGLELKPDDLSVLVRHAVDEARLGFPGTELELSSVDAAPALFDSDRMGQVVSNLLSNARHHGKLGRPIKVALSARNDEVVLAVTNEGGPIPPETRAGIFQPFKVESLKHRANRSGLGLGLYIVHEIVKSHAGRIEIEDGGGAVTFRVFVPRCS